MLNVPLSRFGWTFVVGFLVASNLNWAVAELVLNPWAIPRLDGFMRTGSEAGTGLMVLKLSIGFMLPLLLAAILTASLGRPTGWFTRGLVVALLVSLASFYGTYTFISGWGNVHWWPLMVTASCDWMTLTAGTLLIAWLQQRGVPTAASRARA